MGAITKFKHRAVVNQIRHCNRTIKNNSNTDIDATKTPLNYSLTPERPESEYEYYLKRKSEVYCYNRDDVNTMAGWIITAPKSLETLEEQEIFFAETYRFLEHRYGKENTVFAFVHYDEGKREKKKFLGECVKDEHGHIVTELICGRPHLHFGFIPIVDDPKHVQGKKICANSLLTNRELQSFHKDLQSHLRKKDVKGAEDILNGSTKKQGRNYTVEELKENYELDKELKRLREIEHRYKMERERSLFYEEVNR